MSSKTTKAYMNANEIMHAALKKLAADGSEAAAMALLLANAAAPKDESSANINLIDQLKSANQSLCEAVDRVTDRYTLQYIRSAQQTIVNVIGVL